MISAYSMLSSVCKLNKSQYFCWFLQRELRTAPDYFNMWNVIAFEWFVFKDQQYVYFSAECPKFPACWKCLRGTSFKAPSLSQVSLSVTLCFEITSKWFVLLVPLPFSCGIVHLKVCVNNHIICSTPLSLWNHLSIFTQTNCDNFTLLRTWIVCKIKETIYWKAWDLFWLLQSVCHWLNTCILTVDAITTVPLHASSSYTNKIS